MSLHEPRIMARDEAQNILNRLRADIERAVFGQPQLITEVLCTMLAGGHVLITGAPGLAKTTLVRVLAQLSGLEFGRIQFTPDLLPSDITGTDVLNIDTESGRRSFEFVSGPIFTNFLLADEINRASPRTQSALLEAMQEKAVTVGGKRHILAPPFMVFATQNPFESEGTFPLPEAQLDRFLIHCLVEYPGADAERRVYEEHARTHLIGEQDRMNVDASQILGRSTVLGLAYLAREMRIPDHLFDLINDIIRSTRPQDELCPDNLKRAIWYGAGTRAGIALVSMSKAHAFLDGSETVRWSDVKRMLKPVLRHRMRLAPQAIRDQLSCDRVIELLTERIESRYASVLSSVN